eukprot:COSAG02_NODE_35095_length_474_cov_0.554667_1_plen_49_part_01
MAVDELSTSYHPAPAYFDDAGPHRKSTARCGDDCTVADTIKKEDFRLKK